MYGNAIFFSVHQTICQLSVVLSSWRRWKNGLHQTELTAVSYPSTPRWNLLALYAVSQKTRQPWQAVISTSLD